MFVPINTIFKDRITVKNYLNLRICLFKEFFHSLYKHHLKYKYTIDCSGISKLNKNNSLELYNIHLQDAKLFATTKISQYVTIVRNKEPFISIQFVK